MSSKFFNNEEQNTLFNKFAGIARGMVDFYSFHAVVGFFRSSGYFRLRQEFENVKKIQILVGINVDNIFRKHNQALLMLGNEREAKEIYNKDFIEDVKNAAYSPDVEQGILQLCEDLNSGKVEMKIHASKNLHAKFYLCLPKQHSEHSDGWVIMGSSNISDSGLGVTLSPRYELNVAMKDFDDVEFCKNEFDRLWAEGSVITAEDIDQNRKKTHIKTQDEMPTPYELYMKVLIDSFGEQVEDDFTITLPDGIRDLKYQKDAGIQGYQMLMEHNGFFLADVVGLGKTIVAAIIARRFIEANGRYTNVLVVYPPALETNWKETFKQFGIDKKTQFVSNGSLSKILENRDNYKDKEEFDLVIVDEAHNFRSDSANRYGELQTICKSGRKNIGLVNGNDKKIMLLSATPLNNRPADLENQILLFQNARLCTIDGISNLQSFFEPLKSDYKDAMRNRLDPKSKDRIDKIYEEIRTKILDKITVRRTRNNIVNDEYYKKDLKKQNITFPQVLPPNELEYKMGERLSGLFYETLNILTSDDPDIGIGYARYRAVEFLNPGKLPARFKRPKNIGENLKGIYRVHMVKRLESSFHAFKRSLDTFLRITNDMATMFDEKRILIAPELDIKDKLAKGWELDKIIEFALAKGFDMDDIVFTPEDFDGNFIEILKSDREKLQRLKEQWANVSQDPKIDLFIEKLKGELFDEKRNPTGKLVVFSESVDTVNYLEKELKERLGRNDIIKVSSDNRKNAFETVRENFDANHEPEKQRDEYNIIITSDVLAEGVNLHRANVIVNYDSPWNASRLMQRIGRVNRIGSVAGEIYNYMFYPSKQGNAEILLYENALMKLQGFHSAFGEDAQIFSREEIVREFQLFDPKIKDKTDDLLELLREVRELYSSDRTLYKKIKALPMKSRTARTNNAKDTGTQTIAFIQSPRKTEYYQISENSIKNIGFLDAAKILKAPKNETAADFSQVAEEHFEHVGRALKRFRDEQVIQQDNSNIGQSQSNKTAQTADKFLRNYALISLDDEIKQQIATLRNIMSRGTYNNLPKEIKTIDAQYKTRDDLRQYQYEIDMQLRKLYQKYQSGNQTGLDIDNTEPNIVLSETIYCSNSGAE